VGVERERMWKDVRDAECDCDDRHACCFEVAWWATAPLQLLLLVPGHSDVGLRYPHGATAKQPER
jgi:hypothetical protein